MLRLPPFRYLAPSTIEEVVGLLADGGDGAVVMAGGTDLLPHLKRRQRTPELIVGLRRVRELQSLEVTAGGARVGAGRTLADLARHPEIRRRWPFLGAALETIAGPTLREMGTIGGNLCIETRCAYYDLPPHSRAATGGCLKDGVPVCLAAPRSTRCWAVASSDAAPLLIALDARVRLLSTSGERCVPLASLYQDDGLQPLRLCRGEVLTEILLPAPEGIFAAYHKIRRRGTLDFAAAGVAVAFRREADGTARDARVVVAAVASAPIVAADAARLLSGGRLDEETVTAVAAQAARVGRPIDNADLTAGWRRRMVAVAAVRALREAGQAGRPLAA